MVKTYVGQRIIHLEAVDSTSNYAAKLKNEGEISSGTVILSDIQTDGRGQRANKWQSAPFENLTFSILIQPKCINNIPSTTINHCVSLALVDFLATIGVNAHIKWPNDIYINTKKIAGILIENSFNSGIVSHSIIGIGININQVEFNELNATSLHQLKGKPFNIKSVLFDIIYHLNLRFDAYTQSSMEAIKQAYDEQLWKINELIHYKRENHMFEGINRGTDVHGNIRIEHEDEVFTYSNGEIKLAVKD